MTRSNDNGSSTLFFVDLFDTPDVKHRFNILELPVKEFFMWVGKAALLTEKTHKQSGIKGVKAEA